MILRLLTLPLLGPIEGVAWIGEQLLERADAEIDDKENLQKRLLALQLAFDMGEISEEDFEVQEEEILLAMQAAAEAEEAEEAD
ncbi:MAG: gas vesicle protein GvpG [Desertifilum sp.]|nr:gas vesicle protein GvpG [Desertifilum sp.]NES96293.1 gas vesicle protein GvpG [Desertifilum sp. SIO1I2]